MCMCMYVHVYVYMYTVYMYVYVYVKFILTINNPYYPTPAVQCLAILLWVGPSLLINMGGHLFIFKKKSGKSFLLAVRK